MKISVVVPVYKEEKSIQPFLERLEPVLDQLSSKYEVIFSLDPSPDSTEKVIMGEIERNERIKLLIFSRRFGQPAATIAGIHAAKGDIIVVIDVDLQDPPELIKPMYEKLLEGYDVVYAQRRSRKGETLVKKIVAYLGYATINKFSDIEIPRNTGDFRVMSRKVVDELKRLNEVNAFLRGLVAYVGFKQTAIEYDRDQRYSGKGNYNRFFGSLKIGFNGLIGFSSRPLSMMSLAGFLLAGFSFTLGFWYVLQRLIGYDLSPGLPTTVLVVTFFAGVQLLGLGLIGEYVGRIYDEVKGRPLYIIDREVSKSDES